MSSCAPNSLLPCTDMVVIANGMNCGVDELANLGTLRWPGQDLDVIVRVVNCEVVE